MKNIIKAAVLIGGITASAIIANYALKKHKEKKYVTPNKYKDEKVTNDTDYSSSDDDISLKERIAKAATDKVLSILAWAGSHEQEMKGIALGLTVVSGAIDVMLGLKKVFNRSKLFNDIDELKNATWERGYAMGYIDRYIEVFNHLKTCAKDNTTFKMYDTVKGNSVLMGEWIVKNVREVVA